MANELGLRSICFQVDDLQGRSTDWLRTATDCSARSASTTTTGGWPMCAGRRESSWRWPSGST